ncbi:MAG: transporter substrate-binding domain-containing protein [Lachnospiraceae bacterium]|nr:transporter substrate-binding domain-containing protein [Lachnospiraceae bacterium]MCF0227138.1 transporter substrate-binding domain-containing protein [Methanobrevibacter sp.]
MRKIKKFAVLMLSAVCIISLISFGKKMKSKPKSDTTVRDSNAKLSGTVNGIDDLPGKKIGVQNGTTSDVYVADYYEEDEEGTIIERYNKGIDAVMALKQGDIDCVIIDNGPARVFASENKDLKILDEPFIEEEYGIFLNKSNGELKNKINQVLSDIKMNGTLDEIIGHWIGDKADQKSYELASDIDRSRGTLVMATSAEFPPYESLDGENVVGIDVDLAHAVADQLRMDLKIENMDFDSVVMAVTSGKADIGVAGVSVTEDRLEKENIIFTDSYAKAKQVILVKQ